MWGRSSCSSTSGASWTAWSSRLRKPDPEERREQLRQVLNWFWHDLSHFMAALGRGELWWACGQLEALRRYCVNLLRIDHGVEAQEEAYEKLERAVPVSELATLATRPSSRWSGT